MNFNALKYVDELRAAGFPDKQAEAQVRVLAEVIDSSLATKQDIKDVRRDIEVRGEATKQEFKALKESNKRDIEVQGEATKQEIKALKESNKQEITALIESNKRDIKELEQRMVIKLGSLLLVAVGATVALSNLNVI